MFGLGHDRKGTTIRFFPVGTFSRHYPIEVFLLIIFLVSNLVYLLDVL